MRARCRASVRAVAGSAGPGSCRGGDARARAHGCGPRAAPRIVSLACPRGRDRTTENPGNRRLCADLRTTCFASLGAEIQDFSAVDRLQASDTPASLRTCDLPAPPGAPAASDVWSASSEFVSRRRSVLVSALAAAAVAAGSAAGDPSINGKRAQAQRVAAQIQQLDASLERARNRYETATSRLRQIEHNLKVNKIALHVARTNLKESQRALMQRLVAIYTSRDDQSTLGVILGATSIEDLVNRVETVQSVSQQDVAVMNEVVGFKRAVTVHQHALVRAHKSQRELVAAARRGEVAHRLAARPRAAPALVDQGSDRADDRGGARPPARARAGCAGALPDDPAAAGARAAGHSGRRHGVGRRHDGRSAVAVRRRRRDCHALPRHAIRVGRREPGGLRLLRPRGVRLRAGRRLASALHGRPVEHGRARVAQRSPARRPRVLRRPRPRRHLHRRRPVHPRAAHRRRREDLEPHRLVRDTYVGARRIT